MNRLSKILLRTAAAVCLGMFLCVSQTFAQTIDQAALDSIMNESVKFWQTPGAAVLVVRNDQVVYMKGFGVKDVNTGQPVTPDTLFAIGSTTKAFTTAAMAMLVDEGRMKWDDPVRNHIPYFRLGDPLASENVTLRDLVTHRTGLSRHDLLWFASPWSREEIIRRIGYVPLSQPFRTMFQYQNIMFLTAGQAVGTAANSTFENFVQKRIFDPLGMKTANLSIVDAQKSADHATPHVKKLNKVEVMPWRNIDNIGPAGSINASVRDLSNWVRMHLNEGMFEGRRLISADGIKEMQMPQMVVRLEGRWKLFFPEDATTQLSYGLGWFINDYRGYKLVMHGGTIDGFRANIVLVPKEKLGVVVLTNLNGTQMPEATAYSLIDNLLGLQRRDWNNSIQTEAKKYEAEQVKEITERIANKKKDTRPSRELSAYVGTYEDQAYGTAKVTLNSETLTLEWSSFKAVLDHFHFDTFSPKDQRLITEQVIFSLDGSGEVANMNFLGVNFKRMKSR